MLIQFKVENHRSLRDPQVLSMVASDADPDDPRLLTAPGLDERLVPVAALYGANASGKSNVLDALAFMHSAVRRSHRVWEPEQPPPRDPFALSDRSNEPSLYQVDFVHQSVRFRYGFVLASTGVEEEWLFAWPKATKQLWFERERQKFTFGPDLHGESAVVEKVTRTNSLFLSAAAQNNHAQLLSIFAWFQTALFQLHRPAPFALGVAPDLQRILEDTRQQSLFDDDTGFTTLAQRERVIRLLRAADVGILDLKLRPRDPGDARLRRRAGGLQFLHKSVHPEGAWLPLEAESAGTVTLLAMAAQIVGVLERGGLLCIDELESSLHPMLALELLRLFQDKEHNQRSAQLLVTTHDTNLLGNVLGTSPLRRDQIWFTEKDDVGATHLYPLTDFHPQPQENLERGYLQGRYGAIPFLGTLISTETAEGD